MSTRSQFAQTSWRLVQTGLTLQVVLLIAFAASCQGSQPATPGSEGTPSPFPSAIPPGLVVEDTAGDGSITGQGVLGAYRFILDPETQTASLEPIQRSGDALGDPYTADITGFLSGNPCNDCFRVSAVGKTPDGYVYADYELRHPFPLPQNNPPQFGDRLDLHVYDVRGIFLKPDPQDSRAMHEYQDILRPGGMPEPLLIDNSGFLAGITIDGQTSAFDEYTDTFYPTQANAHPYVMMHTDTRITNFDAGSDNGWTDLYDPIGHNVFPQGGGPYTQRVVFTASPGETVEYLVVLAANFASAAQGNGLALGKRGNPAYYLPWANMKSPWRVRVEETSNTLEAGNGSSEARLQVQVFDWQHHLGVLTQVDEFRAENQSRNSLLRPSRVLDIEGSIPGVSPMSEVNSGFLAGVGTPQDPLIYEVICPNTLEASEGTYLGALAIRDEYTAGEAPEGLGNGLTPFVLDDFTTYVTFTVQVAPAAGGGTTFGSGAQVYNNNNPNPNPNAQEVVGLDPATAGNLAIFSRIGLPNEYLFAVAEVNGFRAGDTDASEVVICSSTNGGATFGQAQLAPSNSPTKSQGQPEIVVVEDSLAPGVPWVHLTWVEEGSDSDVFYSRSNNIGTTWSPAVRVHSVASGDQRRPHLAVNPLDSKDVYIALQETRGGSSIRVVRDSDGDGIFDQEKTIDNSSILSVGNVRLAPTLVFPPASAGEPNTFALTWTRNRNLGTDIMATTTSTGFTGLGQSLLGVSNESGLEIAVDPFPIYAISPSGLDLVVAFNQQTLVTVTNPLGGNSIVIGASKVMLGRKRAGQPAFDATLQVSDTSDVTSASTPVMARTSDLLGHALLMVWHDNRNRFTSGSDIFFAKSSDRGATWTPDELLVGATGNQRYPSLVVNAFGKHRMLYRDENKTARQMLQLLRTEE